MPNKKQSGAAPVQRAASCSHSWQIRPFLPLQWDKNLFLRSNICPLNVSFVCPPISTISWKEGLGFHYLLLFQKGQLTGANLRIPASRKMDQEQCLPSSIFLPYDGHSVKKKKKKRAAMSPLSGQNSLRFHWLTGQWGGRDVVVAALPQNMMRWTIWGEWPAAMAACLPDWSHPTTTTTLPTRLPIGGTLLLAWQPEPSNIQPAGFGPSSVFIKNLWHAAFEILRA